MYKKSPLCLSVLLFVLNIMCNSDIIQSSLLLIFLQNNKKEVLVVPAKAKKVIKVILIILLAAVLIVGGYVAYVMIDYHRIEDNQALQINDATSDAALVDTEYKVISYNIGFAAYTPDFGFFMDGGTQSRAESEESV